MAYRRTGGQRRLVTKSRRFVPSTQAATLITTGSLKRHEPGYPNQRMSPLVASTVIGNGVDNQHFNGGVTR